MINATRKHWHHCGIGLWRRGRRRRRGGEHVLSRRQHKEHYGDSMRVHSLQMPLTVPTQFSFSLPPCRAVVLLCLPSFFAPARLAKALLACFLLLWFICALCPARARDPVHSLLPTVATRDTQSFSSGISNRGRTNRTISQSRKRSCNLHGTPRT